MIGQVIYKVGYALNCRFCNASEYFNLEKLERNYMRLQAVKLFRVKSKSQKLHSTKLGVTLSSIIITLFFNGAIWRVWGLHHDSATIQKQILNSKSQAKVLDMQIKQAKDPSFIERQAKDKLDFVGEHDLVFVFSDN